MISTTMSSKRTILKNNGKILSFDRVFKRKSITDPKNITTDIAIELRERNVANIRTVMQKL